MELYDLVIIGSGPAGLTASIYASRYHLTNLVIGKLLGGTMTYAHRVENYPGFVTISGIELGQKMAEQVKSLGAEIVGDTVVKIKYEKEKIKDNGSLFIVITESGKEYGAKALIVATGTERRKLNIPGEDEYLGKGVSYCTTCDIPFFKDKTVVVVGGADSACTGAIHAAEVASKVYLIYRKEALRAEPVWVHEVAQSPKIEVLYNSNLTEIKGDGQRVTGVRLDREGGGEGLAKNELQADGVFIEIGGVPVTALLAQLGVVLDQNGFVKVGPEMETNLAGLFAAGDIANVFGEMHQITIATSEGSVAASSVFKYLKGQAAPESYGGTNK
jgi:thioredoxin reductase (NADPH)